MAIASFKLYKCTGTNAATENLINDGHFGFLNADVHSTDTGSYAIAIPATAMDSPNTSYETHLVWELDGLPDTEIQNVKVYGEALYPDDPDNKVYIKMGKATSGTTPQQDPASSSISLSNVHDNYYSSGTAFSLGVQPGDSKLDAQYERTNYLVLQLYVEDGASSTIGFQTFWLVYDET